METSLNITKALGDGNRVRAVMALMWYEELCVCQIVEMLHLASATVSRHMHILQNARLVQSRKEGRWVYYRLAEAFPALIRNWLLESLAHASQIVADRVLLEVILAQEPEDLCRQQKAKRGVNDVFVTKPVCISCSKI